MSARVRERPLGRRSPRRWRPAWPIALGCAMCGCRPDFGDRESLITSERMLAVRGEPPEAKPGEVVSYDVLVASPGGPVDQPAARWAFCAAAKPLADNNSVSRDCLDDGSVRPIGGPAPSVSAATPEDACSLFGPDVPPGGYRARDADVTGGYYQPVRARVRDVTAFGMERITCDLADAPVSAVTEYGARYHPNRNPVIHGLEATVLGAAADLDRLPAGATVTFTLRWDEADAEAYPVFDRASQEVVDRREALRASWYTTSGELASDRTGRDEDDLETTTENDWLAPTDPGPVHFWVVLRDSRGGTSFASYRAEVVR